MTESGEPQNPGRSHGSGEVKESETIGAGLAKSFLGKTIAAEQELFAREVMRAMVEQQYRTMTELFYIRLNFVDKVLAVEQKSSITAEMEERAPGSRYSFEELVKRFNVRLDVSPRDVPQLELPQEEPSFALLEKSIDLMSAAADRAIASIDRALHNIAEKRVRIQESASRSGV